MTKSYLIKKMDPNELNQIMQWVKQEGWNPGFNDGKIFYDTDPQGFFVGILNNELIAAGSAVNYDDHFAFCGLYLVKPEFRGHHYGLQLTKARLQHVGNRITGLDGVINMTQKYERLGYIAAHRNIRYELTSPITLTSSTLSSQYHCIVDLNTLPMQEIKDFDQKFFPAPRLHFLQHWIQQPNAFALGYIKDDILQGYGVIRPCVSGYKIGPLFANSYTIAQSLLTALCAKTKSGPFYLDIPEPNQHAQRLVKENHMQPVFEVLRMYRNGKPDLNLQGIYGITSFELG